MKMKKVISLVLSAAMAASLCGCLGGSNAATTAAESSAAGSATVAGEETTAAAAAETKEHSADAVGLKLSTTIKELELTTVPNGMGVQAMADYLDEQDGGVYLDMYLDGVLGSSTDELLGGAQTGAFDMVALSFGNWGDYTDGFAALSIPYLFTSSEQVYAYIDGPEGDAMKQQVEEDTGMVVLAFLDVGFRNITNSRGPIKTPDDVKGLKLRTQNDRYQIAALEALGATCSVISFSELYSSLQQGLVDAQENPIINTYTNKFYEVQDYMTLTRHAYTCTILAISRESLDKLTPEQQQLVLDAGKVAQDTAREKLVEVEDDYLEKLGKEMEIYDPTQEELEAFQKVAMTSWDIIEQDMGSEKFNEIVNAAQEIADSLK